MSKEILGVNKKFNNVTKTMLEELKVDGEGWVSINEVIKRITNGEKFDVKGSNIHKVRHNNGYFLSTDPDEKISNNLGSFGKF